VPVPQQKYDPAYESRAATWQGGMGIDNHRSYFLKLFGGLRISKDHASGCDSQRRWFWARSTERHERNKQRAQRSRNKPGDWC